MSTITTLALFSSDETERLANEAWALEQQNGPATFAQLARIRSLAASADLARQRLEDAIADVVARKTALELRPIPLRQFVTSAAIDASYGDMQ